MKKLFIIIILGLLLGGCYQNNQQFNKVLHGQSINNIIASEEINGEVKYKYYTDEVPADKGEDINLRTANAQFFPNGDKMTVKIYSSEQFYKKDKWYQIEYATVTKEEFNKINKVGFFEKLLGKTAWADTIYSGAGDGHVYFDDGASNWATVHAAAVGTTANYTGTTAKVMTDNRTFPSYDIIYRLFLPFDTSAIPNTATLVSATLNVYVTATSTGDDDAAAFIMPVETTQANSATLVTADYNEAGATTSPEAMGDLIYINTIGTSAYKQFNIYTVVVKRQGETSACGTTAGYTCLGLREGHDTVDDQPGALVVENSITISTSNETGTSQDPYLTIIYTTPTPNGDRQLKSGVRQLKSGVRQLKQ